MEIKCSKCRNTFKAISALLVKQGPLFHYYSCPSCKKIISIKVVNNETEEPENLKQDDMKSEIPGWLIVHDETVRPQSFDLKVGKNLVGRKSSVSTDIAIETEDMTMSRQHCVIEVALNERTGEYNFFINDFKSTNGTIVNSQVQRKLNEQDILFLNDGDTFQLGSTKIVFRKNIDIKKKEAVVKEVSEQPYMPTVVIDQDMVKKIYKQPV